MHRAQLLRTTILFGLCLLLASALSSCGGGGTGGAGKSGSVALLLTDGPTSDFTEVNVTITRVELIGGDRKVSIFYGSRTVDLLRLADESTIFSVSRKVPARDYEKIRLHVSSIELVRTDGTRVYPRLPANGHVDLNPRSTFSVRPGVTLVVQADLDAERSIHVVEAGSSGNVLFRPVVFVDIIEGHRPRAGKLVRVTGKVSGIDLDRRAFRVCPEKPFVHHATSRHVDDGDYYGDGRDGLPREGCVAVFAGDDTSVFDTNGDRVRFAAIQDNTVVTVVGHVRIFDLEGEPYRHGRVCPDDTCVLGLDAAVVEFGRFLVVEGVARSEVDGSTGLFSYEVSMGQGFVDGTMLDVLTGNGTRVFSRLGRPLAISDIVDGLGASVDGVLDLADGNLLKAALVILDTTPLHAGLAGTITGMDPDARAFDLIVPGRVDTTCVVVPEGAVILSIELADSGFTSTERAIGYLTDGAEVELYGAYTSSGCFRAKVVLVETPSI